MRGEHIGQPQTLQVAGKPGDSPEMQFEKTVLNDYYATGIYPSLIRDWFGPDSQVQADIGVKTCAGWV